MGAGVSCSKEHHSPSKNSEAHTRPAAAPDVLHKHIAFFVCQGMHQPVLAATIAHIYKQATCYVAGSKTPDVADTKQVLIPAT